MATLTGVTLGKYELAERLGRGGMAEVYRAYQPGLNRDVAVKVMHAHLTEKSDFVRRFKREARAVADLRHPNIVQVFDFDIQDDNYYMVMEYIQGIPLSDRLEELGRKQERMSIGEVARIFEGLCAAVAYAHDQGMVHRDIKSQNVMLADDGRVVLTDFGIARIYDKARLTMTDTILGTPAYMSPEQAQGQAGDERADIYAMGVMLYECLTGQVPYDADTPMAIMLKHIQSPIPILHESHPDLPGPLDSVILKALAKERTERYQAAGELWADLAAAYREEAPPESAVTEPVSGSAAGAHAAGTLPAGGKGNVAAETARAKPPTSWWDRLRGGRRFLTQPIVTVGALLLAAVIFGVVTALRVQPASTGIAAAREQLALGNYADAVDLYSGILADEPAALEALVERAEAYWELEDYSAALADAEAAAAAHPDHPLALTTRANYQLWYFEDASDEAIWADFAAALEIDSEYGPAYYWRAYALYYYRLAPGEAVQDAERAVALLPDDADAHALLGAIHVDLGDFAAARKHFERATQIDPESDYYFAEQGRAEYQLGNSPNALTALGRAIELAPDHAPYYAARAYVHYQLADYDAAQSDIDAALDIQADEPSALYARGLVEHQRGRPERALEFFDQLVGLDPSYYQWPFLNAANQHEINLDRGFVLHDMGALNEALAAYTASVETNPEWFAPYYYRALVYLDLEDTNAARADFRAAYDLAETDEWREFIQEYLDELQ